jgi:hypothetical protein
VPDVGHASANLGGDPDFLFEFAIKACSGVSPCSIFPPGNNLALVYAGLGDNETALKWLRQAAGQDDVRMRFVPVDPVGVN